MRTQEKQHPFFSSSSEPQSSVRQGPKLGVSPIPTASQPTAHPLTPVAFFFAAAINNLTFNFQRPRRGRRSFNPLPLPPFPPLLFLGSRTAELSLTPGHPKHLAPPTTTTTGSQHVTELCLASARTHKWPRSASRTRSPAGPSGDLFSHAQGTPPRAPAERALDPEGLTAASTTISGAPWPTTWPRT